MQENRKALGQYMTPDVIADLVAQYVPADATNVIDLAAGDCSLLSAVHRCKPSLELFGYEIDDEMHRRAKKCLSFAKVSRANGLTGKLHEGLSGQKKIAVVGNPPFAEIEPTDSMRKILRKAFPGLITQLGRRRAEVYFLARSLNIAKINDGVVAILMPISFADGDIYSRYRAELMKNYALKTAIEIPESVFVATEARTVLLIIDTSISKTTEVDIGLFDVEIKAVKRVHIGKLESGQRLDARYYDGREQFDSDAPKLKDIGVTITRGQYSHKEAKTMAIRAIHTSDLARATHGEISLGMVRGNLKGILNLTGDTIAQPGDILLPRTGSRVSWNPVIVTSGSAPITDHVFRIRAPSESIEMVKQAFMHPSFTAWLKCTAKGVCATVLTKRELLTMPLFGGADLDQASNRVMATS